MARIPRQGIWFDKIPGRDDLIISLFGQGVELAKIARLSDSSVTVVVSRLKKVKLWP